MISFVGKASLDQRPDLKLSARAAHASSSAFLVAFLMMLMKMKIRLLHASSSAFCLPQDWSQSVLLLHDHSPTHKPSVAINQSILTMDYLWLKMMIYRITWSKIIMEKIMGIWWKDYPVRLYKYYPVRWCKYYPVRLCKDYPVRWNKYYPVSGDPHFSAMSALQFCRVSSVSGERWKSINLMKSKSFPIIPNDN